MKRVLLTGANGFIGRHCIPILLEKGFEIHAITSRNTDQLRSNAVWHTIDLMNLELIEKLMASIKPTHLLHLAWYTVPQKYWTSLRNLDWVQASLSLLRAFERHGGRRVVMAGTCAEYDWSVGLCSERSTPLEPVTVYGTCKHSLQKILRAFSDQTGISSAWGRIFYLYGPFERTERLVPSIIRSLLKGDYASVSNKNLVRDFLHVQDVASAFISLLESRFNGPINLASGSPVSLKEVASLISEKLNRRELVYFKDGPSPQNEPGFLVAEVDQLKNDIGWRPKYDLEGGLEQTIDWWKEQLRLLEQVK